MDGAMVSWKELDFLALVDTHVTSGTVANVNEKIDECRSCELKKSKRSDSLEWTANAANILVMALPLYATQRTNVRARLLYLDLRRRIRRLQAATPPSQDIIYDRLGHRLAFLSLHQIHPWAPTTDPLLMCPLLHPAQARLDYRLLPHNLHHLTSAMTPWIRSPKRQRLEQQLAQLYLERDSATV